MPVYRLPVFNLVANIWHNELTGPTIVGPVIVPARAPDFVSACQLYFNRYGTGLSAQALKNSSVTDQRWSGFITLRLPKDADIRAPWGVSDPAVYDGLDLVEVPAGSGRLYLVTTVDQAHLGMPNEYRVALVAQVGGGPTARVSAGGGSGAALVDPGSSAQAGAGGGAATSTSSPASSSTSSAGGGSSTAVVVPPGSSTSSAGGGSSTAVVVPPASPAVSAGGGSGKATVVVPIAFNPSSAGGGSAIAAVNPGKTGGTSAGGGGASAVVSSGGGGTPTPGTTCAGAVATTLPIAYTGTVGGGPEAWWSFPVVSGTRYHLRITLNSGFGVTGQLNTGACGVQSTFVNVSVGGTNCNDALSPITGTAYLRVFSSFGTAGFTVSVDSGSC